MMWKLWFYLFMALALSCGFGYEADYATAADCWQVFGTGTFAPINDGETVVGGGYIGQTSAGEAWRVEFNASGPSDVILRYRYAWVAGTNNGLGETQGFAYWTETFVPSPDADADIELISLLTGNYIGNGAAPSPLPITVTWTIYRNPCHGAGGQGGVIATSAGEAVSSGGSGVPSDGRLCQWLDYAIYTDANSIKVYAVNENSRGYFVLGVNKREIDRLDIPTENVLIKQSRDQRVRIYELAGGGTYQVHVGAQVLGIEKFVRFDGLPATNVYCGTVN